MTLTPTEVQLFNAMSRELELLRTMYHEVANLTLHHDCIGEDVAVVYPSKLGQALEKVNPNWAKYAEPPAALDDLMRTSEEMGAYEPVAVVHVHAAGGNAGISWSAVPLSDAPLMKEGDVLYAAAPASVPAYQPMTDEEAVAIVREASRGAATRRDGTTSTRIVRATESAVLARVAAAPAAAPVAWRVRGYAAFKTGEPGPWRYVDGPARPKVNNPECCDFEPLYLAAPAAVQPAFDPSKPCVLTTADPTRTYCERCKNPHHACDQGAAVQPVAQQQPSVHQVSDAERDALLMEARQALLLRDPAARRRVAWRIDAAIKGEQP